MIESIPKELENARTSIVDGIPIVSVFIKSNYDLLVLSCPDVLVKPQPDIVVKRDKVVYTEGDLLSAEIRVLSDGVLVPGNVSVSYGGEVFLFDSQPVLFEVNAVNGELLVEYFGVDDYSPSSKSVQIVVKENKTSYWKLVLKYLVLIYLFFRLLWWIYRRWWK